ncbi:MAG: ABC transporter permease [Limisphaerales bacterium]
MRQILAIGHNDLRLFLRNRAMFVWLFAMPLGFVYFMGFANRGPGGPSVPRPTVLVDNKDAGFLGGAFLEELGAQGLRVVGPTNEAEAKRGIRIPADFTSNVVSGAQGRVDFFAVGASDDPAALLVEVRLARAILSLNGHLLEDATGRSGAVPTAESLAALRAREDPVVLAATHAGRKPIPTGFNLSLPGVMVMYLMMNLLTFGGASIAWERRAGVLKRIVVHPVTRGSLIVGKLYGLLLLAGVQVAFLLVCGRVLFRVNLGDSFVGILLVLLVYSWVAASLGVLVGGWVRSEDKVVGLCVLAGMVMAALGGCWWPLEVVPDPMKFVAYCLPTGWALDALHQLITFGAGLGAVTREVGVLALFGVAANVAAVRWFRV